MACREDNEIAVRTLRFWIEYFDIIPVRFSAQPLGESQFLYWYSRKLQGGIDVIKEGGYGLNETDFKDYVNRPFFVGNADLDRYKIRLQ